MYIYGMITGGIEDPPHKNRLELRKKIHYYCL